MLHIKAFNDRWPEEKGYYAFITDLGTSDIVYVKKVLEDGELRFAVFFVGSNEYYMLDKLRPEETECTLNVVGWCGPIVFSKPSRKNTYVNKTGRTNGRR